MKKQLAGFEVTHIVKELQILIGAKVDKVFNPDKKSILIQFHKQGKQILHILAPEMMYLSQFKEESGEPTGLAMHLRKILVNSRLKSVRQIGFERVIEFVFEVLDHDAAPCKKFDKESSKSDYSDYSLFVELFGAGNIILVNAGKIVAAVEYRVYNTRALRPGEKYICPIRNADFFKMTKDELAGIIRSSSKESIVKALALDLGLGGVYAEELCILAGIDKKLKFIGEGQIVQLFDAVHDLRQRSSAGFLVTKEGKLVDVVPVALVFYEKHGMKYDIKEFSSYNGALVAAASLELSIIPKASPYDLQIVKVKQIIEEQTKTIDGYEKNAVEEQAKAEMIYSNYQLVEAFLLELNKARKSHSSDDWNVFKKKFEIFKEINEKVGKVVIEFV